MKILSRIKQYPKIGLILLAYVAFSSLGLPDGLMGVGWPSIRNNFSVPLDAIGLLLFASVAGYMTASFFSGFLLTRLGVGRILAAGSLSSGLALLGYTLVPQWWMMILLAVFAGLGAGAIDAGLNTYFAAHFAESLMQWLHASWGVGITIGPIIMTYGLSKLGTWRFGYRAVAIFQIILAICFALSIPIWNRNETPADHEEKKKLTEYKTPLGETLKQPSVWLSVLLFFLYVGAETSLGTWTYTLLTESRGVDPTLAGFFVGSYWFTFTIGRIVGGMFTRRLGVNKLVIVGISGALLGSLLLVWNPFVLANVLAVALIGFSIAPIFPGLMSGTRSRVGDYFAANTIGMQMAATGLGIAVIPSLMGVLARQVSLEIIPVILLAIYTGVLTIFLLVIKYSQKQNQVDTTAIEESLD